MSLINEMLRDLESRQPESARGTDALSGLHSPATTHGERSTSWRLWLQLGALVLVTVAVGGLAAMHWSNRPAPAPEASRSAPPPPVMGDPVAPVVEPLMDAASLTPAITSPTTQPEARAVSAQASPGEQGPKPAAEPTKPDTTNATPETASPSLADAPPTETSPAAPVARSEASQTRPTEIPATAPATPTGSPRVRSERSSPEHLAMRDYEAGLDALQRNARGTAETRFRDALDRVPALTSARVELARLLIADRRTREAGELLAAGLALNPEHSGLTQLRARLFIEEGALDDAVALLRASPPRLDENPEHHALLAAVEQRRGRDEASVEIYRQLVVLRPESGQWQMGLAISLERLGAREPAVSAYASALEDPRLPVALRRYAQQRLATLRN